MWQLVKKGINTGAVFEVDKEKQNMETIMCGKVSAFRSFQFGSNSVFIFTSVILVAPFL